MSIPIEPFVITRVFTSATVEVSSVDLGVSALVRVVLINQELGMSEARDLVLNQPEYSEWGLDDQFVVNWAFEQLGIVKISG